MRREKIIQYIIDNEHKATTMWTYNKKKYYLTWTNCHMVCRYFIIIIWSVSLCNVVLYCIVYCILLHLLYCITLYGILLFYLHTNVTV